MEGNRIYIARSLGTSNTYTMAADFLRSRVRRNRYATILQMGEKYYLVFKDERKEPLKKVYPDRFGTVGGGALD